MKGYIVESQSVDQFVALAGTHGLDLDNFDERVSPATVKIIARPQLNYFVESYTLILQDRAIELSGDALSEPAATALSKATGGACAWFPIGGAKAQTLIRQLEGVTITEEDVDAYLGISDDDFDMAQLRKLHAEFTDALRQIGPSQIGFFRADL